MPEKLSSFNKNLKIAMGQSVSSPYISINKLAEYMNATSTRRREIVKSLKQDKDFITQRYQKVKVTVPSFFRKGYRESILDKAIADLESDLKTIDQKGDKWNYDNCSNSILALQALKETTMPDISDFKIVSDLPKLESITLAGVKVTIKPELYLRNIHSNKIGALKIHIAKTEKNRLTQEGMQYAATIIKYGFIENGYKEKEIDNNGCISLGIFEKNFGTSPRAYKRDVNALTASCQEIALWWDAI
jgi:hypothetical protein